MTDWALVPREATPEMTSAADDFAEENEGRDMNAQWFAGCLAAMVALAPDPVGDKDFRQDLIDRAWEAIQDVHDMDATLTDYARAAVDAILTELRGKS